MGNDTVLVVDDDKDVLRSMEVQLRALGCRPVAMSDAEKIFEAAERERPGLLLQDLKMKNLNLPGLMASLRSNPSTVDLPIVFFSASPDVASIAAKYDAWGYLRKPFSEEALVEILQRTLGSRFTPPEKRAASREPVNRDIKTAFHDYWNLLSALNSYVQALGHRPTMTDADKDLLRDVGAVIVRLEAKTEHLQSLLEAVPA